MVGVAGASRGEAISRAAYNERFRKKRMIPIFDYRSLRNGLENKLSRSAVYWLKVKTNRLCHVAVGGILICTTSLSLKSSCPSKTNAFLVTPSKEDEEDAVHRHRHPPSFRIPNSSHLFFPVPYHKTLGDLAERTAVRYQ